MANTNTIDKSKLEAHREMLLDSYRCELRRLAERVNGAQQRYELGTHPEGRGNYNPISTHDAYNMSSTCQDLQKVAAQIEMVDTVLRSLTVVPE